MVSLQFSHVQLEQKLISTGDATTEAAAPAQKKARVQVPDEYLPANNILFVQNLPEGTTSDDLREVFEA